jgi:signal transduction histidine kinase
MVLAARVVLVLSGILLGLVAGTEPGFRNAAIALLAWAVIAAVIQIRFRGGRGLRIVAYVEPIITVGAVATTGGFDSQFGLMPAIALILIGYLISMRPLYAVILVGLVSVGLTIWFESLDPSRDPVTAQFAFLYLLCGAFGTFTRRLVGEVEAQRAEVIDQSGQMTTVNDLLVSLHGLAQTLPAALDPGEAVISIRERLRGRFRFHGLVILVPAEGGNGWRCELAEGVSVPRRLDDQELPDAVRRAIETGSVVTVSDRLDDSAPGGFSALCRSGMYAPLSTRGTLTGVVALEHDPPNVYGSNDAEFLDSVSGIFGLTLDNARWFSRLRTLGAEAERSRIARELHDRIAQSLAYIAFELERLESVQGDKRSELADLREVVRGVVQELRETIYQLRTAITEDGDLAGLVAEYLDRFGERSGIATDLTTDVRARLAPRTEQEVWRIIQEALNNVVRHASASTVTVSLRIDTDGAVAEIVDDGRGFDPAAVDGEHYGLIGMRERAEAIGAQIALASRLGAGTTVRVEVPAEPASGLGRIALPPIRVQP